jgi:hypothetical protein
MLFWGIKRTVAFKANLWAMDWGDMTENQRLKIESRLKRKARKFYALTEKRYSIRPSIKRNALRYMFKRLVRSYADTEPDKIYWKSKGWI